MAIEKTFTFNVDTKEALERLEAVEKQLEEIADTNKKTESAVGKLAKGFKGVGLAMKAAGFAIIMKLVDKVTEALMKNQEIADTVETVFNSISLVFKMVSDTLIDVVKSVTESTENFDAMQKVVSNLLTIAITPFKLAFDGIKLGIQSLQLVWEKSVFGGKGKDLERIEELTASIQKTKESLKETGTEAVEAGKTIATNFVEAVGEVVNVAKTTTEAFKETFEDVTITSIIEQGKAITATKKNYELLALEQQRLIEQYDREAEAQRQIRDDVRLTVDERIEANNRLAEILQRQTDAEKEAIQNQIDSVEQLQKLEGVTNERTAELFALKTELIAVDAKILGMQSEQKTNEAGLQDERVANLQELTSIAKTELELQLNDIDIQAEQKKELAKRTISDEKELQNTLLAIDEDASKKKIAIEQAVAATRRDILANTLGEMTALLGEESKAGKALAVGQALINTYSAATAALAPPPLGAGPIFGPVAAVGAIASGLANVKKIVSTKLPGPDTPSPDLSAPDVPSTSGLMGDLAPNMEAIAPPQLGGTDPIQAYVVESNITNSQALQEELEIQATL